MSQDLVILLHGVGSNGADMAALGQALAPRLPGVAFASPNAPMAMGAGHAWFSIAGVTQENRPDRVLAARPAFDALIERAIADHDCSNALRRVAFLGFSQGAIMALDALASGRWPVGGVIAFSGRLASPAPLTPSLSTPLLLVHGEADRVMPVGETIRAADILGAAGVATTTFIEPALGHQISVNGLDRAARFLQDVLA